MEAASLEAQDPDDRCTGASRTAASRACGRAVCDSKEWDQKQTGIGPESTAGDLRYGTHSGSYCRPALANQPWRAATSEAHSIGFAWCSQFALRTCRPGRRSSGPPRSAQPKTDPFFFFIFFFWGGLGKQRASEELTGRSSMLACAEPPTAGSGPVLFALRTLRNAPVALRLCPAAKALFAPTERDEHITCVRLRQNGGAAALRCRCTRPPGAASWVAQLLFHTLEIFGLAAGL